MRAFGSPYAPVPFIDEVFQIKVSFVSKPYAIHIDIAAINHLHHIVSEYLSCIIGSSSEGLLSLNFILWCTKHYVDVGFFWIAASARRMETRGHWWIICCTSWALPSVVAVCSRPTFPAHSSFTFPVDWIFSHRTFYCIPFWSFAYIAEAEHCPLWLLYVVALLFSTSILQVPSLLKIFTQIL